MKKILIISHEATLTGAPILLLHMLRALQGSYRFTIVLKRGGPLEAEFAALGTVYILKGPDYSNAATVGKKISTRLHYFLQLLKVLPAFIHTNLVFSNTVTNGRLLALYQWLGKKTAVYTHELTHGLRYYAQAGDTQKSLQLASVILYPGRAVMEAVMAAQPGTVQRLQRLPYYFPAADFTFLPEAKIATRQQWRKAHNIPQDATVVVGMGTVSARKGTQLFVDTALALLQQNPKVYFVWIGGWSTEPETLTIKAKWERRGYPQQIIFTGALPYHPHLLLPFDLFFLSSVEDAYPLVVVEAAYMQVPAACLHNGGGIVELLEKGAGYILPTDAPQAIAEELGAILQQPVEMAQRAAVCNNKVHLLHSDKEGLHTIIAGLLK